MSFFSFVKYCRKKKDLDLVKIQIKVFSSDLLHHLDYQYNEIKCNILTKKSSVKSKMLNF